MHRREFLSLPNLATSAGHILGLAGELAGETETTSEQEIAWLRFSHPAMATTFELIVPFGTASAFDLADRVFNCIDASEAKLTVYREDSFVSELNRRAALEPVELDDELLALLRLALQLHRETEGAFDCAIHRLIECWGFFRGPPRVPEARERQRALSASGSRWLHLDEERRTLRFLRPGVALNFGSIGKGYALDRAAALIREEGTCALLQGGRSSVLAVGHPPGQPDGWCVAIRHPLQPQRILAEVRLKDNALGTSAFTFRYLDWRGKTLGHILDPRTGWPASGMWSATAIAPTAAEADALATAFFILGVDKTCQFCRTHPHYAAILLPEEAPAPLLVDEHGVTALPPVTTGQ